jgi:hypothetical protein
MEPDVSKDTSVFLCYADADSEYAQQLKREIADLGFTVHDVALTLWEAYREKVEEAILKSDYYIIIFSEAFFEELFAREQLNALFDAYVLNETGRKRKVLPVVRNMQWEDLRKKSPLFGTMRPMDSGKTDKHRKKLAKLFYEIVEKDSLPLPTSSKLWQWEETVVEVMCDASVTLPAVRQLQMVENKIFSTVLVTDYIPDQPQPNQPIPGDLVVEVDGKSLKSLTPEELNVYVQRFQSYTDYPQSVKVQRRKVTSQQVYRNIVEMYLTGNKNLNLKPALPTAETVCDYWDKSRCVLEVVTPLKGCGLDAVTVDDDYYVFVTKSPVGCPLSRGDRLLAVNSNYIDQTDFQTVKKKLLQESHSFKLTVQHHQTIEKAPGKGLYTLEKLWKRELACCEVKKRNGTFGLSLMKIKIKDLSSKRYVPVIQRASESGLFYGELISAINGIPMMDYDEVVKKLRNCADGDQIKLSVQRPNKRILDDYINEMYKSLDDPTDDDADSSDSSMESEDSNNSLTDVCVGNASENQTAIVGVEQSHPVVQQMQLSLAEECKANPIPCQPEASKTKSKVVVNPGVGIEDQRGSEMVETVGSLDPAQLPAVIKENQTATDAHQPKALKTKCDFVVNPSADVKEKERDDRASIAVVETEGKIVHVENAIQDFAGDKEPQATGEDKENGVVSNPSADPRDDYHLDSGIEFDCKAFKDGNVIPESADRAAAGEEKHEQDYDQQHDFEYKSWISSLTGSKQRRHEQLLSAFSKTQLGGEQTKTQALLMPYWTELRDHLDADAVVVKLLQHGIISLEEKREIQKADNKNERLLMLIGDRPWKDGIQFLKMVTQIDKNYELGQQLLLNAGE